MIGFILWLLCGALLGWLACLVLRTDPDTDSLLNITAFANAVLPQ